MTSTFGIPRRAVVSYEQAHLRLKMWRGRPDSMQCIKCSETARHWAYMGDDPNELRDHKNRPYSLDFDRYEPMCVPCHHRMDRAKADGRPESECPRGHLWAENERVRRNPGPSTGLRFCLACNRENSAAWHARKLQSPGGREYINAAARQWRAAKHAGTLTVGEVADLTGLRYRLVADACRSGALRAAQSSGAVRGRWRIHRDDLDAWLRGENKAAS